EISARLLRLVVGVENARRVAVEVAHDEVELRSREPEPGHLRRIRDTAQMPGPAPLPSTDLEDAVERSADPTAARTLLARLLDAHPAVADDLYRDARVRDGVVALAAASRSLSSALVADPGVLDALRDAEGFAAERSAEAFAASWTASGDGSPL